jgi:flagellin-like protein
MITTAKRKGITPIIAIIVLLLITMALAASAWLFMVGYAGTLTNNLIQLSYGSEDGNRVTIINVGNNDINTNDLTVTLNGEQTTILNPQIIPAGEAGVILFDPIVTGERINVKIIATGSTVTYNVDIEPGGGGSELTIITVTDVILQNSVNRFGLNIAGILSYEANVRYMKNIITNPGFEAAEKGRVLNLLANNPNLDDSNIQDLCFETEWIVLWPTTVPGEPEGFWDNAEYEFMTGNSAGTAGNIEQFYYTNDTVGKERYTFKLDKTVSDYSSGDVVAIRKNVDSNYIETLNNNRGDQLYWDTSETRLGSTGEQSLRLNTAVLDNYVRWYLDNGAAVRGKQLIAEGDWKFSIWARAANAGDKIKVEWFRPGVAAFISEEITLDTSWQEYEFNFNILEGQDPENSNFIAMEFNIYTSGLGNSDYVWVDDVFLGLQSETNPTEFSDVFVNKLKEFQPGSLRNWNALQHGSTLDNQLADVYSRKTTNTNPKNVVVGRFTYSLHEFLELAKEVDANPWYVIPPSFSESDIRNLIDYLAGSTSTEYGAKRASLGQAAPWTDEFDQIFLELANEAWGGNCATDPFIGATFRGGIQLGKASDLRYQIMKDNPSFDSNKITLVIGGQSAVPQTQQLIVAYSTHHDSIAIAGYYGKMDDYQDEETLFGSLYAAPFFDMRPDSLYSQQYDIITGSGYEMTIYETNYHTTNPGDPPQDVRNNVVTGIGGGIVVPLRSLVYMRDFDVKTQNIFQAFQYAFIYDNPSYVNLWGVFKDLESKKWSRPSGVALEAANKALFGDMVETQQSGVNPSWIQQPANIITEQIEVNYVQSFAFKDDSVPRRSLILFNLDRTDQHDVSVNVPTVTCESGDWFELTSDNIYDNNEDVENVKIVQKAVSSTCELTLAPFSLNVLVWN